MAELVMAKSTDSKVTATQSWGPEFIGHASCKKFDVRVWTCNPSPGKTQIGCFLENSG